MIFREFNFDGLVGPTHNYAGLSHGNIASEIHQHAVSSPKAAALQGLRKMAFVKGLGVEQCVLPPLKRPDLNFLRKLGFSGGDTQVIEKAYQFDPVLLSICYSASNMWTANAATVSPSPDTLDNRLHVTPANLTSNLHRSIESKPTTAILRRIFSDGQEFVVHDPMPGSAALSDEGAANHTRLCRQHGDAGIEIFVFGAQFLNQKRSATKRFPARQTLEASQAIARTHGLDPVRTLFVQQSPESIDAGVFHNDVICVGNQNVLLVHENAFSDQQQVLDRVKNRYSEISDDDLYIVEISANELPLKNAVSSYLFNSQVISRPDGVMSLICPAECERDPFAIKCIQKIVDDYNPINEVHFLDLRQSMNNGGGPACLRLRVVLSDAQADAVPASVRFTDELKSKLEHWVDKHYRDEIRPDDLRDPALAIESFNAIEELASILNLPDLLADHH